MSNLLDVAEFREWLAKQPAGENSNLLWSDNCPIARFLRLKYGLKEEEVFVTFYHFWIGPSATTHGRTPENKHNVPRILVNVIKGLGELRPGQDDPDTPVTNGQVLEALDKALA